MGKRITDKVTWVGKIDWELKTFHGDELSTHKGTSYNSYLIRDEKTVLIDTVWNPYDQEFVAHLKEEIDLHAIDAIVVNHSESDHSGALPVLMREIPDTPIYCTKKAEGILRGLYHKDWNFHNVKTGDTLCIGENTLTFVEAPMCHWPDTMVTYADKEEILFSNDVFGRAAIYYAFDNTVNSSRYPYYSYMKGFWTAMGLHTRIDSTVTVSDLKRMNDYGLCILSAHGSYYTYTSGFLFKQTRTEPVILLTEESDFYKDLYYGIDLLTHRVIKINGLYCITPSFFQAAYRGGQLKDTVVLSETCEFLGVSGSLDTSMADALLAGGAKAVAGYVNNVYTVYSRSMLWDTVNHLILGQSLQESVQHSMDTYGADDLVWYNAQGGKRPHAAAAYPLLFGDVGVRLIEPNAAPVPQEVQQAA